MLNDDKAPPGGEKIFIGKPGTDFLSVVFWRVSHISHRFRIIRQKSISSLQRRPLAEKICSFESQTSTSLLMACWHVLPKSYRFRVIRVTSIRPLQRRPLAEKIFWFESLTPTYY
jgi:hypothetical protein